MSVETGIKQPHIFFTKTQLFFFFNIFLFLKKFYFEKNLPIERSDQEGSIHLPIVSGLNGLQGVPKKQHRD